MNRWPAFLVLLVLTVLPFRTQAQRNREVPQSGGLIYRPGEGWTYEFPGDTGKWRRESMKEQVAVAQAAFDKKDYRTALKAARRVVNYKKGVSDYAPQAQYLMGRIYEVRKKDEKAFKLYQTVLEKYPKTVNYQEVQLRQFEIATRFLNGQRFKLFGIIPLFTSMDKTADMFEKVVKNGPYSEIAPRAEMNIGAAREKKKEYPAAVKAYERVADRYSDQKAIAAEALFKAGLAYHKQAKTADYDQSIAGQAIATFTDFKALYPDDPRNADSQKIIASLNTEQARGNFATAKFYEKNKRWEAAKIYYNEARLKDPESPLAAEALKRIYALNQRTGTK